VETGVDAAAGYETKVWEAGEPGDRVEVEVLPEGATGTTLPGASSLPEALALLADLTVARADFDQVGRPVDRFTADIPPLEIMSASACGPTTPASARSPDTMRVRADIANLLFRSEWCVFKCSRARRPKGLGWLRRASGDMVALNPGKSQSEDRRDSICQTRDGFWCRGRRKIPRRLVGGDRAVIMRV
jgi:hypothetical protein